MSNLSDVLYVATRSPADLQLAGCRTRRAGRHLDTDSLFDAPETLEIVVESEEEVQSLKVALGGYGRLTRRQFAGDVN